MGGRGHTPEVPSKGHPPRLPVGRVISIFVLSPGAAYTHICMVRVPPAWLKPGWRPARSQHCCKQGFPAKPMGEATVAKTPEERSCSTLCWILLHTWRGRSRMWRSPVVPPGLAALGRRLGGDLRSRWGAYVVELDHLSGKRDGNNREIWRG